MEKTRRLRQLLSSPEILLMPGIHDVFSARLAEKTGFGAFFVGGYAATASLLGKPDISFLTLTEMADHAARLRDAVDIPFLVDADTGYGGVLHAARTVRVLERAGAAGLMIEDQVFPKRCGHMEGKEVIATPEMEAKIRAALDARSDPDFLIMARTDALAVRGLDEAIGRALRYREAGADILFVEAPRSVSDMRRIAKEIDAPTVANMVEGGKSPFLSAPELQDLGFRIALFPVSATYALARAVRDVWTELLRTGTTARCLDRMWRFDEFYDFMEVGALRAREADFQRPDAAATPERRGAEPGQEGENQAC